MLSICFVKGEASKETSNGKIIIPNWIFLLISIVLKILGR